MRTKIRLGLTGLVMLAALMVISTPAEADVMRANDHPDGGAAPPTYGLRINNDTFTFDDVLFITNSGSDTATLNGTITHNQSGQQWQLTTALSSVVLTNDGDATDWNTGTGLYDGITDDMSNNMTNNNSAGEGNLKDASKNLDRLVFKVVDVTLTYDDIGAASYTGVTAFDEYPNDAAHYPMIFTKGHRLDNTTDQLTGFGWLEKAGDAGRTSTPWDFLFTLQPVPEPGSILLMSLGMVGLATMRKRRRRA